MRGTPHNPKANMTQPYSQEISAKVVRLLYSKLPTPTLLLQLRKVFCLSRKQLAEYTHISPIRLRWLEDVRNINGPTTQEEDVLQTFYSIPFKLTSNISRLHALVSLEPKYNFPIIPKQFHTIPPSPSLSP
jgi:hypothetical protein